MNKSDIEKSLNGLGWSHGSHVFDPPPEKTAPVDSLHELEDINSRVSSIVERLDRLERDAATESDRQAKRFRISVVIGIASAVFAGLAALVSAAGLCHP